MGNQNAVKTLRGQVRQLVQDLIPQILTEEMRSKLYAEMVDLVQARLKGIEDQVKETMLEINQRSVDAQEYLMRNVTATMPQLGAEENLPQEETPAADQTETPTA